jgi:hypothetical protein
MSRFFCTILCLAALDCAAAGQPSANEVYARATNSFGQALFCKPAPGRGQELVFQMAPLILQEVEPGLNPQRFGSLSLSQGAVELDLSRPAIYGSLGTLRIKGKAHTCLAYLWCYSDPADPKRPAALQGIRITLNSAGEPAIWEVLAMESGRELIFVSDGLEAAARKQFGQPLPGRRYAVEPGLREAPEAIVARVIETAPVLMGPIVYLRAGTRAVHTLICRCMPSQAKQLAGTTSYELESGPADDLLSLAKAQIQAHTAFWPGGSPEDERIERRLRLPGDF